MENIGKGYHDYVIINSNRLILSNLLTLTFNMEL